MHFLALRAHPKHTHTQKHIQFIPPQRHTKQIPVKGPDTFYIQQICKIMNTIKIFIYSTHCEMNTNSLLKPLHKIHYFLRRNEEKMFDTQSQGKPKTYKGKRDEKKIKKKKRRRARYIYMECLCFKCFSISPNCSVVIPYSSMFIRIVWG